MRDGETSGSMALPMWEFVALIAFSMALTALSVDIMLPVLPDIVGTFDITSQNDQQFMVTVYMTFFAIGQIFCGPISDRFGRRPTLLGGLALYMVGTLVAVFADSYAMLLAARAIQGIAASAPRIVAIAVVRDLFAGRGMSQVMSFVMSVFIMLPIIAPALGTVVASAGSWRLIFLFLLLFALVTAVWSGLRLPETNKHLKAGGSPPVPMRRAARMVFTSKITMGYMFSLGFIFACLMAYIASTQQVFADIYGIVDWFPLVFASVAAMMVVSSIVNARLVQRLGMRPISHTAMLAQAVLSVLAVLISFVVDPLPLSVLMVFLGLSFFLIGLMMPNFNALAMEPLGEVAGMGSSIIGFVMTGIGAFFGGISAHFYDGTLHALLLGFVAYSAMVVILVVSVERGGLLQPHHRTIE